MNTITKEQFLAAYDKYPPNFWIRFAFRYFSTNTVKKDLWVRNCFAIPAIVLFLVGMFATIFNMNQKLLMCSTCLFAMIVVLIAIIMFGGAIMNNCRIRGIRKELGGISKKEYDILVNVYMD
jgi:hypothetical protein